MLPAQQSENRFEQAEYEQAAPLKPSTDIEAKDSEFGKDGPGNPGPPIAPIDDYLPILVIVAVGLIILKVRKKTVTS